MNIKAVIAQQQHEQIIARIEAQEGESLAVVLRRLYVEEELTYQELMARWQISLPRVMRLKKEYNVSVSQSEVAKRAKAKTAPQRKAASIVTARIEKMEGEPVASALQRLYVEQKLTYRQLMERWGIQARKMKQLLRDSDLVPRELSEAVALQWVGNVERRETMSSLLGGIAKQQAAEGRHSCLGRTKDKCPPGRFDALIAAGQRPEVREKHAIFQRQRFRNNPAAHPNAKVAPTSKESLMLSFCHAAGYKVIHNQPVVGYWIDVYLPELKVGIECVTVGRHPSWARHQKLIAQGIHMLYVMNTAIEIGELIYFAEYVTALPALQKQPEFRVQDAVIWGSRRVSFFPDTPDGMQIEVVSLQGSGCLRFSCESSKAFAK